MVLVALVVVPVVTERHPRLAPPQCPVAGGPPAGPGAGAAPAPVPAVPLKGPVGWDVFRELDELPILPIGTQPRMFSSADPRGGNHDGFRGAYLCRDGDEYVLGEHAGPGELTSMWFTRRDGDVSANGRLRVELDGETVIDAPLQEVVDGKLGAPFMWPLVANADQSSGGVYIQVPMPFRRSMRVTTDAVPRFYRVQYRAFADTAGVERFDPSEAATDVIDRLQTAGAGAPQPLRPDVRQERRSTTTLPPGQSLAPVRLDGPGMITALRLTLPQVQVLAQRQHGGLGAGSVEMAFDVDPDNRGVRILRRSVNADATQTSPLVVNEAATSRRFDHPRRMAARGFEQQLHLPAEVTAGRGRLLLADVDPGPATLEVQSRVGDRWVTTDRRELPRPALPGPDGGPREPDEVLQGLHLRIAFDGQRTVDVPVGQFFGVGLGERPAHTLLFAVGPVDGYHAWWPMPFARGAEVSLHNVADFSVSVGQLRVDWHRDERWARQLGPEGHAGHFHATHRAGPTVPGRDWEMAALEGHGRVVGFTQTFRGRERGRTYLEGDERIFVDGARSPQVHGTGTEDLYLGGWYFNRGPFATPFSGLSAYLRSELGCRHECDAVYRVLVADSLAFHDQLAFRIEHGIDNDFAADYGSTVFWYGRKEPGLVRTDSLDVGNPRSERDNGYEGRGRLRQLTALHPGHDQLTAVADRLRESRDTIRFRVALDPDNAGVLLRRRADQARRGQAAHVLVDGVSAGTWYQPDGNRARRWLDDDLLLPASLTRGREGVEITLQPLAGAPPWTAARYEAFSLRLPAHSSGSSLVDAVAAGPPASPDP